MNSIRTILLEVFGLFVDDGFFAVGILLWLALIRAGLSRVPHPSWLGGAALFGGLAVLLLASAFRYSRRSQD